LAVPPSEASLSSPSAKGISIIRPSHVALFDNYVEFLFMVMWLLAIASVAIAWLIEGVVKRFGGFQALGGVTFHVQGGERFGLIGPNGSGKTG